MKTTKKIIAIVLSVMLLLSVMPMAVFAATTTVSTVTEFETAVANASAGDTIKLGANIDFTTDPKYAANSYSAEETYVDITGLTIDLDGNTITNNTAGLKFSGSNCVIKNGKFIGVADTYTRRYGLALWNYDAYVQGEADSIPAGAVYGQNVVLEDLEVDGGINILGHRDVIIRDCTVYGNSYYAVYLNFASDVTIESGSYTAANTKADGIVACYNAASLDPQYSAKINIEGGTFTLAKSKLVLASSGPVEVSGGTYKNADSSAYTVPAKYIADGATQDASGTVTQTYVAKIGETYFETMDEALAAAVASNDATVNISLLTDSSFQGTYEFKDKTKNVYLEFNGFTLTADCQNTAAGASLKVYPGTTLFLSGTGNYVTANTPAHYDSALIKVYGADSPSGAAAVVNFDSNSSVNLTSAGYCISMFPATGKKVAYNASIIVGNATSAPVIRSTATHDAAAIAVSGNIKEGNSTITLYQGDIIGNSTAGVGLYVGGMATVTTEGNYGLNISGANGIYQKCGSVTISNPNATVTGNGAKADYKFYGNGFVATGDAYVVENCGYPGGTPTATINAGNIVSENGDAVASYVKQDDPLYPTAEFEEVDEIITATSTAVFSSDVTALAEDGYKTVYDEAKGGYVVEEVEAKNGANLALEGTIEENIYMDAAAYDLGDDAVIKVTYNANTNISETPDPTEETYLVKDLTAYDDPEDKFDGTYKFSFKQAPAQITEDVTVALYADENAQEPVKTITYSVKDYCDEVIETSNNAKLVALCKSILDYARAAQLEFNYNTDNMAVDTFYNAAAIQALTYSDITGTRFEDEIGIRGCAFQCLANTNINLYFDEPLTRKSIIALVDGDDESTIKANYMISETNGLFVSVNNIEAGNMTKDFTIITSNGAVTTNLNTIVKTCLYYGNAETLAKTIYFYANAADAYFN